MRERNGHAFPDQCGRLLPLFGCDQVQSAELVVAPPATPVRERLHHRIDVALAEFGLRGRVEIAGTRFGERESEHQEKDGQRKRSAMAHVSGFQWLKSEGNAIAPPVE